MKIIVLAGLEKMCVVEENKICWLESTQCFLEGRTTLDSSWEKFEVTSGQTATYQPSLQATRGWHAGRRKNIGSQ